MTEHEPRSDRFAVLADGAEKGVEMSGPHRATERFRELVGKGRDRGIETIVESDRVMSTAELPQ